MKKLSCIALSCAALAAVLVSPSLAKAETPEAAALRKHIAFFQTSPNGGRALLLRQIAHAEHIAAAFDARVTELDKGALGTQLEVVKGYLQWADYDIAQALTALNAGNVALARDSFEDAQRIVSHKVPYWLHDMAEHLHKVLVGNTIELLGPIVRPRP